MCFGADSLLKLRPQCGHLVLSGSSTSAHSFSSAWSSSALALASASPPSAFVAKMLALNSRDFFFHAGIGLSLPSLLLGLGPDTFTSRLCALATITSEPSTPSQRFAALSNFLRSVLNTFLQMRMCFSTTSSRKLRWQSGH